MNPETRISNERTHLVVKKLTHFINQTEEVMTVLTEDLLIRLLPETQARRILVSITMFRVQILEEVVRLKAYPHSLTIGPSCLRSHEINVTDVISGLSSSNNQELLSAALRIANIKGGLLELLADYYS